jgi:hypothetical protein
LNTTFAKEAAMFRTLGSAAPRSASVIALGAVCALLIGKPAYAQAPAAKPFLFPGGAGLVLNFIKPDKAAEWEAILEKVKEGLKASEKPERKAQANAWKIFKASEQAKDAVIYMWVIDGAPVDQEYSMVGLMTELFPKEAAEIYKQYSDCYTPPNLQIFHLTLSKDFSK